ncbi:signal transduction histidine kinase/ligand-binding sensor domain-containing protein/DNA-binding response OmpR family regulator [Dysgonomonas hofstadii]|uniref:histidine kinase n=1 Tax=Dysgonomonas hofstadii TaxID=637886 RepID=A0A840CWV4_9BACT|nr:two-component regulator propeller domain-containing protein [Dysgonomonas hofstadii]MBB4037255.1 signal transduction histidine kinase/ligand-binding sensor domain-containing protein/DNA-binding response OmpR family regulator [Dysgonomonas hofstadii]
MTGTILVGQNSFKCHQLIDASNQMSESVYNIVKDEYGFIWIASRTGVSRYDGRNIKHYYLSQSEVMENKDGREVRLKKTANNTLWAFTDTGRIYYYDSLSDSFVFFKDIGLVSQSIIMLDLYIDSLNQMWLGTTEGLYTIPLSDKSSIKCVNADLSINSLTYYPDSLLILGTTQGVLFFNIHTQKLEGEHLWAGHNVMSTYHDKNLNYLWAGSFSSGMFVWDIAHAKHLYFPYLTEIPCVPIKAIRKWGDDLLIGLDGGGVYKLSPKDKKAELYFSADEEKKGTLKANGVYDLLIDKNNIWIATYSGGVTIAEENEDFEWIRHIPYKQQSVKGSHIYAILEDKDKDLWFATNAGVSYYNIQTKQWRHFLDGQNNFLTLTEDNEGKIWTGGYSTGIYCIDKNRGVLRHIPSMQGNPQLECLYASLNDSNGDLWFGCLYSPLGRRSVKNGIETFTYYDIKQVKSLKEISHNKLFIATSNGFYILNTQTGKKEHFFNNIGKYNIKSNSFVYSSIFIGNEIWFGTDGGGLNVMNLETNEVENFSTYNELPSNFIFGMLRDKRGILWISTDKGLFCFDPHERKFMFNVANLPTNQFLFMSFAQLHDGRMAFGGTEGAVIFDPDNIRNQKLNPRLFFTDFRLSYQIITPISNPQLLSKPIDELSKIELKHDQNSFSFGYTAIDLYNSQSYEYKYKLENFDDDWVGKDASLSANYTNIPPGNYLFRVQCFNKNDGEILGERSIQVVVKQPFWNTIWAWLLYITIFSGILYWIWRYYRERLLKKQSEDKIKFFVNVAHDIRTPLSLVLAPLNNLGDEPQLTEKGKTYLQTAMQNGEKLLQMTTQLLDFQKEAISPSKINLSIFNLNDLLTGKLKQFTPFAEQRNINLYLELPGEGIIVETDLKKIERIVDNLLSNAIKYSYAYNDVYLRLKYDDKSIIIEIEDFGIGISKENRKYIFKHQFRGENTINSQELGSGVGLMFTKKLAEQLGGNLHFNSEENKGTIFYLSVPLKGKAFISSRSEKENGQKENLLTSTSTYRHESYRILLVEDNNDMRNYLLSTLSPNYKIYGVPSAEEALDFLENNTVDLVISDIMMDGMQGDELCKKLKSDIHTSHIHVILLTAIDDESRLRASLEYGADDYIVKPFDIDLLKVKVNNFLNIRKRIQQHYITKNKLESAIDHINKEVEEKPRINNIDDLFLEKCIEIVTRNIPDSSFSIDNLCSQIGMSRTLVYEKLKVLAGQSPNEFIRVIRLKYAKELLENRKHNVKDVALLSGFDNVKYFSTVFKKYYGQSPSDILSS